MRARHAQRSCSVRAYAKAERISPDDAASLTLSCHYSGIMPVYSGADYVSFATNHWAHSCRHLVSPGGSFDSVTGTEVGPAVRRVTSEYEHARI